jgi:hypothetical protein
MMNAVSSHYFAMSGSSVPSPIVITNCTGRKVQARSTVSLRREGEGATAAVAATWAARVKSCPKVVSAADLYAGRAFQDAHACARAAQGRLAVVSAGLGLVWADEPVPHYDLTIAPGDPAISILPLLHRNGDSVVCWWRALNFSLGQPRPLAALLQSSHGPVLLAMPGTYLDMVSDELSVLPAESLGRLRIFTSRSWLKRCPAVLASVCMPYDERLEALPGFAGTRVDFAQRAALHFVQELQGHKLNLPAAVELVQRAMASLEVRRLPARSKRTDEEILATLRANWHVHRGQSAQLLRFLRDEALVQCEQSRFKGLWHQLKSEQTGERTHGRP